MGISLRCPNKVETWDCTHIQGEHGAFFEKDFGCSPFSEIMLWEKQDEGEEEKKKQSSLLRLSSQRDYSTPHYLKKNKSPKAQPAAFPVK